MSFYKCETLYPLLCVGYFVSLVIRVSFCIPHYMWDFLYLYVRLCIPCYMCEALYSLLYVSDIVSFVIFVRIADDKTMVLHMIE